MRIPTRMTVLALLIPVAALPASKQRDWQQGKLLDSNQSRVYLGTIGTANNQGQVYGTGTSGTYSGSASSHHLAHYGFDDTYVIDSEKYVYVVMRMRKNRLWCKRKVGGR